MLQSGAADGPSRHRRTPRKLPGPAEVAELLSRLDAAVREDGGVAGPLGLLRDRLSRVWALHGLQSRTLSHVPLPVVNKSPVIWRKFHLGFGAMRGLFGEVDGGL